MSLVRWDGIQPSFGSRKRALFLVNNYETKSERLADEKCSKIDRTCDKWEDLKAASLILTRV